MEKLSIKNLIEFRRKSPRARKNFVLSLANKKDAKEDQGGGDYWVTSVSAISNGYKLSRLDPIIQKRKELEEKHDEATHKRTKTMHKRNIDILYAYEDIDMRKYRAEGMKFLKKIKDHSILTIDGLQVEAKPHHIFTFGNGRKKEIGAIWFIAKLDGFRTDELGMFTDVLYRYLKAHFAADYNLNPAFCIAVDVFANRELRYSQLISNETPRILNATLKEIKALM